MKIIRNSLLAISLMAGILSLTACKPLQPIATVYKQPTPYGLSSAQVAHAIKLASLLKGWHAKRTAPGVIVANMNKNAYYYVRVKIPYSKRDYSINYLSSRNLMASNGQIHRAYNKWVQLLNKKIQAQLSLEARGINRSKLKHG